MGEAVGVGIEEEEEVREEERGENVVESLWVVVREGGELVVGLRKMVEGRDSGGGNGWWRRRGWWWRDWREVLAMERERER